MIAKILTIALPFLAPFMAYYIWFWFQNRDAELAAAGRPIPAWHELPWAWLVMSGSILLIISLLLLGISGQEGEKGKYIPPYEKDGVIVPGHWEK